MPEDNTAVTNSTNPAEPISPVLPTVADDSMATPAPSPVDAPADSVPQAPAPSVPDISAPSSDTTPATSPVVVNPFSPDDDTKAPARPADPSMALYPEIASKISEAHNVLIALSSDPSVDEMAAAIGLSIYLDKLGKRATAIYSGSTPNALEFLNPEQTFEPSADTLQDFVIALSKEKADHLRYKLDGNYVKIYITPFKARLSEEDLEFSYGDYNVDLVLALDVANGIDLDSALREHGRIMHDAVIINITTGNPGKFGEIEWSDKHASSVSEMIAKLLYSVNSKIEIGKEEATAFLTGIVAATNRFSNASTTPETMQLSSKLMRSGANQQLVSKNITPDVDNQLYSLTIDKVAEGEKKKKSNDPTKLDIEHKGEEGVDESKEVTTSVTEKAHTLLDDLKAAEASLGGVGAETTKVSDHTTLKIDNEGKGSIEGPEEETPSILSDKDSEPEEPKEEEKSEEPAEEPKEELKEPEEETKEESTEEPKEESKEETDKSSEEPSSSEPILEAPKELFSEPSFTTESMAEPSAESPAEEPMNESGASSAQPEKVLQPSEELTSGLLSQPEDNKYGHMLEEALEGLSATEPTTPTFSTPDEPSAPAGNPATMSTPAVPANPEINGVPEMNYMPMPGEEILPPPPAPAFDSAMPGAPAMPPVEPIAPAMPTPEPTPEPLGSQPSMQDQVYTPQASDPGAFKIPGM